MTQIREKILDDVARMAGGTVSVLSGMHGQAREDLKTRIEEIADRLDLVPRTDFERLELMLIEARQEQEEMKKRIAALEGKKGRK